ncbi:MAG: DUF4382 domain-containing protein [Dehalococcoidia bacterium]
MSSDFDRIFDECLDRLSRGEKLEDCLRSYPEMAGDLEPLLAIFAEYSSQNASVPGGSSRDKGRERLLQRRAELQRKGRAPAGSGLARLLGRSNVLVPLASALAIIIIGLTLGLLIPWASDSTEGPSSRPPVAAKAGILEIRVTDAPSYEISAVNVTISDIEVHRSADGTAADDEEWDLVIEGGRSFELLELRGVEDILGSRELETGHYTQIRMNVEEVTVTLDGAVRSASLPSGKLKLIGSFDIQEGTTTVLTLDFDAEKSVVVTGNQRVIFKPTVKLIVRHMNSD